MTTVALAISAAALILAGLSLWISWRGHVRSGFQISVAAGVLREVWAHADRPLYTDILKVTVRNTGMASVQITRAFYEIEGDPKSRDLPVGAKLIPGTIDGMSELPLSPSLKVIIKDAIPTSKIEFHIRAGVVLATGRTLLTDWISIDRRELLP